MEQPTPQIPAPLDWSSWSSKLTNVIVVSGVVLLLGLIKWPQQFAFSWLVGFMFCLSIGLGGFFLVLVHHLFDASWSVPIRRINENLACLLPWMIPFFLPIAYYSQEYLFDWMRMLDHPDHALAAKQDPIPLFTIPGFYISAILCFAAWWFFPTQLRRLSIEQDQTGSAECTIKMRRLAYVGIFAFAFSLTLAAIQWMKGLQHAWFSTMYGVYYFAGSVWTTLATVYIIVLLLQRQGVLKGVITGNQYYYLGTLLLAFTVFYSYIHFSQYFIIWNGNVPEETFWYAARENGTWRSIAMIIIFGHFFVPFLSLLRIDVKLNFKLMFAIACWAWLMHFVDMSFNILPVLHPDNYHFSLLELAAVLFIGGILAKIFIANYAAHSPYPLKDPRTAECYGIYVSPEGEGAAGEGAK